MRILINGLMATIFKIFKMKINYKSVLLLLLASAIWGFAFVAQNIASKYLESFTITGVRSLIGFAFLFLVAIVKSKIKKEPIFEQDKNKRKTIINASIICGTSFAFAYNFQQFGIALYPEGTSVSGRAGFLTGLYVLFVPIICFIFFKKKIKLNVILGLLLAVIGLYLLCFSNGISNVYLGDLIIIACGIFFALQIIFVDKYNDHIDAIKFGAWQFLVCGILSMIMSFIFEDIIISNLIKALPPLFYLGICSCAVAGFLQIIGQKLSSNPTVDAIAMSFESVFAVIGGILILHQMPLFKEVIGCFIMFISIVLSQITFEFKKEIKKTKNIGERHV